MSDLLEKAVIDAKALKEVATKNAEASIVEKYSQKIKESIERFLEQEEDDMMDTKEDVMDTSEVDGGGMEMGGDGVDLGNDMLGNIPGDESVLDDQVPFAFEPGMGADEEIEIDFSELEKQLGQEKDLSMDDMVDHEDIAKEIPSQEEELPGEEDGLDDVPSEMLEEIVEALEVDYEPKSNGWYGSTEVEREEALDGAVAKAQETEEDEEKEKIEEAKKEKESLDKKNVQLIKENKKLKENVETLLNRLNESNITNAKLLYMNQVLKNISLNEKQKRSLVEEISKADSVDKAKIIYEALSNSVGVFKTKPLKSLNEIVSKTSMTFPLRPNTEKVVSDPFMDRMKELAGINKK